MEIDFSPAINQLQEMINSVIGLIPNLIVALIMLVLFYFFAQLVEVTVTRVSIRSRRNRSLAIVLGRIAEWTIYLLGILVASVIVFPNFTPAQVIQLLGIGSVAIGFAFRDILQNFLSGILLLISEPFRIGDQIVFGDYEGTVEEILTRATTIRTYDGRRVVIPNGELFTQSVIVNTAFESRRIEYDLGIGYEDNIEQARELILATLAQLDTVLEIPPPDVLVFELSDYSVVLRVRWWIAPPSRADALDTRDQVLGTLKEALLAHGIDIPFPTHQILFPEQRVEINSPGT